VSEATLAYPARMICSTGVARAPIWKHAPLRAVAWALYALAVGASWNLLPQAASAQPTTAVDLLDTEDDSSRLPWRGTSLSFVQSLNVNTFFRGAQQSYNPTYSWAFILEPRWYFNKNVYANIDQRLFLELTNSDTTLYSQRAMLSDTILGVDMQLYEQPLPRLGELSFNAGLHLIAPTSIASRAASMVVGTRVRGGAAMIFKHVLQGASLAVQGRYTHRFLRHNTAAAEAPFPCLSGGLSAQNCEFMGGLSSVRDSLGAIIMGSLQLTKSISLDALVWLSWARAGSLAPFSTTLQTGYVVDLPDNSLTHWRNDRYIVLGASWTATDWLQLQLSVIDYFPEKAPDGSNRGLFNPLDVTVGLTTSIAFDRLYLAARGKQVKPMNTP